MAEVRLPGRVVTMQRQIQNFLKGVGWGGGGWGSWRGLSRALIFRKRTFCNKQFLCQLTCQSADIMSSLCGVGVRVRVNNFFSKTTRPRDMLFFLKDTLSIEDEKLFKACKSVCSSVC